MSSADPPIRIVIADDEPHFRQGLRWALETSPAHIDVVGEVSDGHQALEESRRLEPDVVLLDVHMPGTDGIEAARAIVAAVPRTRILMLTVSDAPGDIALAAKAGAAGYLLKERSLADVAEAVVSLAHGQSWPQAAS